MSEYQVQQAVRGADVLVGGDPDVDPLTSSVVAALRRHGLSDPEVAIRVVTDFTATTRPTSSDAS